MGQKKGHPAKHIRDIKDGIGKGAGEERGLKERWTVIKYKRTNTNRWTKTQVH